MASELMTIQEAADYLGLANSTVRTLLDTGRLPHVVNRATPNPRKGRRLIRRSEVEAYRARRGASGA